MTVSAPVATTMSRSSSSLAGADVGGGVGLGAALDQRRRAPRSPRSRRARASSRSEVSASSDVPCGPDPDEHDALEAQLAVLDLGDVGELGATGRRHGAATARSSRSQLIAVGVGASSTVVSSCSACAASEDAHPGPRFRARQHAIHRVHGGVSSVLWGVVVSVMCSFQDAATARHRVDSSLHESAAVLRRLRSSPMGSDHYFSAIARQVTENLGRIRVRPSNGVGDVGGHDGRRRRPARDTSRRGQRRPASAAPTRRRHRRRASAATSARAGGIAIGLALCAARSSPRTRPSGPVDVNERAPRSRAPRSRRVPRGSTMSTPCCPTMFPTTSCSAHPAPTRRSGWARTSCTDCSSAGCRGSTSARTRGSSCSATSARTRCSAGWRATFHRGLRRAPPPRPARFRVLRARRHGSPPSEPPSPCQ